jgi:hypothetical protein
MTACDEQVDDCYRCGYSLHGLDDEHPCPECGLLARRSRRSTDELHVTRPRWMTRISTGANLILLSIRLRFLFPITSGVFLKLQSAPLPPFKVLKLLVGYGPMLLLDLACVVLMAGVWLLASPEGYPPADQADRRLRRMLRLTGTVPVLQAVLRNVDYHIVHARPGAGAPWTGATGVLLLLTMAAAVPLPWLLFVQLRILAKRARSAHLAEHCSIVGAGTSAVAGVVALLMTYEELARRLGRDIQWMHRGAGLAVVTIISVAAMLMGLWSIYLLVRFAIAFLRASRQMRRAWSIDDRSATAIAV